MYSLKGMVIMRRILLLFLGVILIFLCSACGQCEGSIKTELKQDIPHNAVKTSLLEYDSVKPYYSDVILFQDCNGYYGLLNNDGSIRVEARYLYLEPVSEKYMAYSNQPIGTNINCIGVITTDGEEIIPCEYDYVSCVDNEYFLLQKFQRTDSKYDENVVKNGVTYRAYFYLYSINSRRILDQIYLSDMYSIEKVTAVGDCVQVYGRRKPSRTEDADPYLTFIDKISGEKIIEEYGVFSLCNQFYYKINGNVVDANGNIVLNAMNLRYTNVKEIDTLLPCAQNSKLGYVDSKGNVVINYEYDNVDESFLFNSDGFVPVKKNEYWGFIDKKGNVVCEFKYEEILSDVFDGSYYLVNEGGYWGYVDSRGRQTAAPIHKKRNADNHCFVSDSKTYYLVNPKTGEKQKEYYAILKTDVKQVFEVAEQDSSFPSGYSFGLATPYEELIECQYESGVISKDGKIYVGCVGNTYTIYTLKTS